MASFNHESQDPDGLGSVSGVSGSVGGSSGRLKNMKGGIGGIDAAHWVKVYPPPELDSPGRPGFVQPHTCPWQPSQLDDDVLAVALSWLGPVAASILFVESVLDVLLFALP